MTIKWRRIDAPCMYGRLRHLFSADYHSGAKCRSCGATRERSVDRQPKAVTLVTRGECV